MRVLPIILLLSILTACGGGETDNGNVPTCNQLDSSEGEEIAKNYLIGSWIDEHEDRIWGMTRFEYDGNQLHLWKKEPKSNSWRDDGIYDLLKVKSYKQTTTYGCTEYVFTFYNGSSTMPIIVESMRGACIARANGREQFIHYKQ